MKDPLSAPGRASISTVLRVLQMPGKQLAVYIRAPCFATVVRTTEYRELAMEATETTATTEWKLEPGETIVEWSDDNDDAVITTRSPKTVMRLKACPSATLLCDIDGDEPALFAIRAELIRFKPDKTERYTGGGNRANRENYKTYYAAAFDPDK